MLTPLFLLMLMMRKLMFMRLRSEDTDYHDSAIADAEGAEGADADVDDNHADAEGGGIDDVCQDEYGEGDGGEGEQV